LAVRSMIHNLAILRHHIRMAFRDSESMTAGIRQGNGAGPHIWAAVSMPFFEVMHAERLVALFICTLSKMQRALAGLACVDDTDLIVNDNSQVAENVSNKMQKLLTMWHGLLKATGGELVPEKCFWYLINFKWLNKQWKYKTSQELPGLLSIGQQTGKIIIP